MEFIGPTIDYKLNSYFLITKIIREEITEEELERSSWRSGIVLLQECKELKKNFVEEMLKEKLGSKFDSSILSESLHDYVDLIME